MIYKSLNYKDPNNMILKKYFKGNLKELNEKNGKWKSLSELYKKRFSAKDSKIEFELDLLENEIQKLLSKNEFTEEEKKIIDNIRIYYSKESFWTTNFFHYLSNPIFNEKCCLIHLFNEEQRKAIAKRQNILKRYINVFIQNYLDNKPLSETDEINMFTYLSSEYIDKNEYKLKKEQIIKKILKKDKKSNYYESKFLFNYIHQKQSYDNDYEACKLYLDYKIPDIDSNGNITYLNFPAIRTNHGVFVEGIIVMNSFVFHFNYNNDINVYGKNLLRHVSIISHESWHQKQSDDHINQRYTVENLAEIIHELLFSNHNFYRTNYDFVPNEFQAKTQQNKETISIISKFIDDQSFAQQETEDIKNKINEINVINSYAMVIPNINSNNEKPQLLEDYIAVEIEKKLKQNPSILHEYKLLQLFYNPNGNLKSFEELVNDYYNIIIAQRDFDYDCDYDNLFYPFFTHLLKKYNLDKHQENTPFNARVQVILKRLLSIESNKLLNMITGYDYYRTFERNHLCLLNKNFENSQNRLIIERLNRFKRYITYIKDSEEIEKIIKPLKPYLEKIESLSLESFEETNETSRNKNR